MLHGEIHCTSEPGKGSTFAVRLPADAEAAVPAAAAAAESAIEITGEAGAQTVLVIDDDPNVRDLLSRHLDKSGYRVATASAGADGPKRAREIQPDAITLDVLMPGMDGWEILRELKGDPITRDIPVIMVTMTEDRKLGYALGATEFLTKPVQRDQLVELLDRYAKDDGGRRALVVDDIAENREMLRRALENEGWSVSEAEHGRMALEKMADPLPSLILLDLMMPGMNGFEVLFHLRSNPATQHIPVIVVTAVSQEDSADADRFSYAKACSTG